MFSNPVPLVTRLDVQRWASQLISAAVPYLGRSGSTLELGAPSAHFSDEVAGLEGFARLLWGVAPLAAAGASPIDLSAFVRGFSNGSDPSHPGFWGLVPGNGDQRLVEMAAIGFSLALLPQLWTALTPVAQQNLHRWLDQINQVELGDNNWQWFGVLVNLGLKRVGAPFRQQGIDAALRRIDAFYLGDGWYSDGIAGVNATQLDYYVPFALHYYALMYAALNQQDDPERARLYRQRASAFAGDFLHWFDENGASVPFGRSLTYRFAHGAFWGALAFADTQALPWGVVKGLYLRQLRWWSRQDITDRNGVLSVGYAYANLNMTEEYNSSGSPFWALKAFLPLALPQQHPFWQAQEEPMPSRPALVRQARAQVLIQHQAAHTVLYPVGQHALWARHAAEKYAKFAYSTRHAFSVPTGRYGLQQGAFDSMLAVAVDGQHYLPREKDLAWTLEDDRLSCSWSPHAQVMVQSWIMPIPEGHLRLHRLTTARPVQTAEGGWAVKNTATLKVEKAADGLYLTGPDEWTGLVALLGDRQPQLIAPHPNTNLLHRRTVLPMLTAELAPGRHWLGCAVLHQAPDGAAPDVAQLQRWRSLLEALSRQLDA